MSNVLVLGEVLMRLNPPHSKRIKEADSFSRAIGGAECNMAVSLANFGHDVSFYTAVPPTNLGENVINFLKTNSVKTDKVRRVEGRLGLYFVENGYSIRPPQMTYDRNFSSFTNMAQQFVSWDELFEGIDLLYISGITPALTEETKKLTITAIREAQKRNITVSFDCNFREKLWSTEEAKHAFVEILPYVDICFAGYKDFIHIMDYCSDEVFSEEKLHEFFGRISEEYKIETLACTNRKVLSTTQHNLTGYLYQNGQFYKTKSKTIEVLDRIGSGDAFASGVINGILREMKPEEIVSFGLMSGLLQHTVHGDHNQFSENEVLSILGQESGDIIR